MNDDVAATRVDPTRVKSFEDGPGPRPRTPPPLRASMHAFPRASDAPLVPWTTVPPIHTSPYQPHGHAWHLGNLACMAVTLCGPPSCAQTCNMMGPSSSGALACGKRWGRGQRGGGRVSYTTRLTLLRLSLEPSTQRADWRAFRRPSASRRPLPYPGSTAAAQDYSRR